MSGLVACSRSETRPVSIASTSYRGMPSDVASPPVEPGHASAVWRGATIELTLWGSGSCPADMVPTTSVLDLPDAVGGGVVLTVWLRGLGSTPVTLVVPRQPTQ